MEVLTIHDLPIEIVHYISLEIPLRSILNISRTNKRFRELMNKNALWTMVFHDNFGDTKVGVTVELYKIAYQDFKTKGSPVDKAKWAIFNNYTKCLTDILIAGYEDKIELLEYTLEKGSTKSFQILENKWSDLGLKSKYLYLVCYHGNLDILLYLVSKGHDINTKFNDVCNLWLASQNGHTNIVEYLISKGYDINTTHKNFTSLYMACKNNHIGIAELLLKADAKIDENKGDGSTALYVASQNGHSKIVDLLLDYKANYNIPYGNSTPLYTAAQHKHLEVVEILCRRTNLEYINMQIQDNSTALYIASQMGNVECVRVLLQYKTDPTIKYKNTYTPLHTAADRGHLPIVKILIEDNRVDINEKTSLGASALYSASTQGHFEVVKYLLSKGANIESCYNNGQTPLCAACLSNKYDIVCLLCKHGANINVTDTRGNTLLDSVSPICKNILELYL